MSEIDSKIYAPYRALGINSDHVPCVIRYNHKHQETYAITSVGRSFHVYRCSNMGLVRVSDLLPDDISCLGADTNYIYASAKNTIYAFVYGRKVAKTYTGHEASVVQILPFASHLLSIDANNVFKVFDIESTEVYLSLDFSKENFELTCMVHPITYLNKILFGSKQGSMQLWNLKSSKQVYAFKSFGSPITVLRQAPALDTIGVGLENGKIILHNLKYDETVMSFVQEWGPISSLTFRTDGSPIMISGSNIGHMAVWNLEDKRLIAQVREAHNGAVNGMHCLQFEPLMVTSSNDNSIKIWIFDMSDGSARLLRQRHGHSQPSNRIRFHDQNGHHILSAGLDSCLMSFSTEHDSKNKSLGRASFNKVESRRTGLKMDEHKMPPIVEFSSNEVKQSDWDSIVCVHENLRMVTTWDFIKSTMGKHKIDHERFKNDEIKYGRVVATCCTLSNCGNYFIVGYSSGHVDLYNIQSGLFRGTYGNPTAHENSIRGVASDALNLMTITSSADGEISFWPFKEKSKLNACIKNYIEKIKLSEAINQISLHRESGMLAVSTDEFNVLIIDCDLKKIVRKFNAHSNKISDMAFSPDARWLLTASMDCLIKVWDLPSGKLIDCFRFEKAPVSICVSPNFEYLATTHINDVAIYLWSNKTIYSHVSLKELPEDYEPSMQTAMPSTRYARKNTESTQDNQMDTNDDGDDYNDYKNYVSPDQIALDLITLSLLPETRWKNLINLDIIKQRNKPKEAPKVPKQAPFFLPTISNEQGFTFKTSIETHNSTESKSKSKLANMFMSDFGIKLSAAATAEEFEGLLSDLKAMGPSSIDSELRMLDEQMGGGVDLLEKFLKFILYLLTTRKNFELANSYLALFLKLHSQAVSLEDSLVDLLEQIKEVHAITWTNLQLYFNKNLCLVSYLKSVT